MLNNAFSGIIDIDNYCRRAIKVQFNISTDQTQFCVDDVGFSKKGNEKTPFAKLHIL